MSAALTLGFLSLGKANPIDVLCTAVSADFEAASLRITGRLPGDDWYEVIGNASAIASIKSLTATGLRLSNISGYYLSPRTTEVELRSVVDTTAELGCGLIVQGCFDPDRSRTIEILQRYADHAASANIRIAVEFMPASEVKSLQQALDLLAAVDRQNVGLTIDPLHLWRSAGDAASLSAAPSASMMLAQICDASLYKPEELDFMTEALTARLIPGDGSLPLRDYLLALPEGIEMECEIPPSSGKNISYLDHAVCVRERTLDFIMSSA